MNVYKKWCKEGRYGRRRVKEKWAAERATPKVRESQAGFLASRSMCLMGNPTEKPLTLNKEERREMGDTERGGKKEKIEVEGCVEG